MCSARFRTMDEGEGAVEQNHSAAVVEVTATNEVPS